MQRSGKSLHNALLFVLALALALGVRVAGAWGQDGSSDSNSEVPKAEEIAATNSTSVNSGAAADPSGNQLPNADGAQEGAAGRSAALRIQPMKGVQMLADSPDLKQMLKRLITSQVPVMYQTMMMVENGAATGFMGSMHTVSNLMDNQVQAASLELAIRSISPDQGADPLAFVNSMRQGIQRANGSYKEAWPVALLWASGDSFEAINTGTQKLESVQPNPAGGAVPTDILVEADTGTVGTASGQGTAPTAPLKLSDILFEYKYSKLPPNEFLKTDVLAYIGDITINVATPATENSPATYSLLEFKKATETGGPPGSSDLRGLKLKEYENKKKIWEQWYEALYAYCDFKSTNPNSNSGDGFPMIFSKKKPSEVVTPEMITQGSARDITMSIPMIDLLFKLFIINTNHDDPTKLDCSTLQGTADATMPDKYEPPQAGGNDDCSGDSAKKCLRNKVLYRLVEMIARSRTVDEFKSWYLEIFRRGSAVNSYVQFQVANLMCQSLGVPGGVGVDVCDPMLILDNYAANNRERWVRHVTELTKLAQFTGGASVFRGSFNNNSNFAANEGGFDSAANANPGGQ